MLIAQSCQTLCDYVDSSLLGSSVHGILQARILSWVVIPLSRGSSNPGIESGSLALQADPLPSEPPRKPKYDVSFSYMDFWYMTFIILRQWKLNFVKYIFCICSDNHVIFILHFVNVVCHIDWFADVEPSLNPWNKSYLIVMYDPFNVLLNLVY